MGSSNIRDILTCFSPALDYLAISTGDGRIKVWDTLKGQVQTEFADLTSTEASETYTKAGRGHLSVDYKCMKWLSLDKKKKRKLGSSLLVLGTGGGDVLALDVAVGQLKWRVSDCHPGGVNSVSFSTGGSYIYTAGADGMICKIDPYAGNLLGKFRASAKAISCISLSSDGKRLATASAQLKIFNCSDHKKIQKFSGHSGDVRCMNFTENGRYVLSSAARERYVLLWKIGGGKEQSASCVLAMEHPAVFLDSWCIDNGQVDEAGLCVLAISETGVCYFWYGQSIDELCKTKPAKVSISDEDFSKSQKGSSPTIFAAKLQGVAKFASIHAFIACGLLVKPTFQKILVHSGTDMMLTSSRDGVLLPMSQSVINSKKGVDGQNKVTALDRADAEDALLPIPKVADFHEKTSRHQDLTAVADQMMDDLVDHQRQALHGKNEDNAVDMEADSEMFCMENRLRSLGILQSEDLMSTSLFDSAMIKDIDLEANMPQKKIGSAVQSMAPSDAYKSLETLVALWHSRSYSGERILPWIYSILVNHSQYIMSQEPKNHQMLSSLIKITKSRGVAIQHLLQLSGRLQLITAQIDKGAKSITQNLPRDDQIDASEDENDDMDAIPSEESESEISSDDDY